jgi:hypothetical protein
MKLFKATTLILLLLPTLCVAQKKPKKSNLPEVFGTARLVYVQAVDGQQFDSNLDLADRMAIADLRDVLKAWGRYTLTPERDKADLIFVVRKGRMTRGNARGGVGDPDSQMGPQGGGFPQRGGSPQGGGFPQEGGGFPQDGQVPGQPRDRLPEPGVGGDTGREVDLLQVCQLNANGKLTRPLWVHTFENGLDAPRFLLLAQFKSDVEKAYPSAPASPSPNQ